MVTDQLYVEAGFPYVINERLETANDNFYVGRGLGDITLRGKYYVRPPTADGWNPYVELGVITPTGDGSKQFFNRRTRRREYMKPYITPGSGTWAPLIGVGIEKTVFDDLSVFFNARKIFTLGENDADYQPGDPWLGTLGGSYVAHRFSDGPDTAYLGASIQLRVSWIDPTEERDDKTVPNTGGVHMRLAPGIFFSPDGGNFTVELAVPFPVYYNVSELQTIERYGVEFTVGYRF